jgi:hypothetical protein
VSDIIATILLVAIVVVLAAVLYVLVAGLTHGPGATPIGSAFAAGNPHPSNAVGTAGSSTCATTTTTAAAAIKSGDWTYTLDIESSTANLGGILLQVRAATGGFDASHIAFYITGTAGAVVACAGTSASPASGSMSSSLPFTYPTAGGATSSLRLTSAYQIVLEMGASSPTGQGFTFDAAGQGSFTGVTASVALP